MTGNGKRGILVVGGGVVGSAVARELARSGHSVTLLERGRPGLEASWAAAGMLAPLGEAPSPGPFLELGMRSLACFPELIRDLEGETGTDVPYRTSGKLILARNRREEADLRARLAWSHGFGTGIRWLTGDESRVEEPSLSKRVVGGLLIPGDHQVENRVLARALWDAAAHHGASVREGASVAELVSGGGRVRGVRLASGDVIEGSTVVLAAGAWTGRIGGLPRPIPVHPVRGQMLALDLRRSTPPTRILASTDVYLVPRGDGRLLVGATLEKAGFDVALTAGGIGGLLEGAIRLVPALKTAPVLEFWAGLRPGTPDQLPILGPDPDLAGLLYATGHHRNGILLAPITAAIVRCLQEGRAPGIDLGPFRPDRFG